MKNLKNGLVTALLLYPVVGTATTYMANNTNLAAIFALAQGGDTIKLTGAFDMTELDNRSFVSALTLDASMADFSDTLVMRNINNVRITGGTFGSTSAPTSYLKAIAVYDGGNVRIDHVSFVGNGGGSGAGISGGYHVTVSNSTFRDLRVGATFTSVLSSSLTHNIVVGSSSDGFNIADSHNITASDNSCSAGVPSANAHPDCIQLWSVAGNSVQSDILISGNTAMGATQGFTAFDHGDGGGLRYQFIHNIVNSSYPQGIACYSCVDSFFVANTLTTLPNSAHQTTINIIGGSNNLIALNTVGAGGGNPANDSYYTTTPGDVSYTDPPTPGTFADFSNPLSPEILADVVPLSTALPEPGLWLQLLAGFGLAGAVMRRRAAIAA